MLSMNKYDTLSQYLSRTDQSVVEMKFSEIESVINDNLPQSARKHRAWWSNNPSNSVITHAWLNAGFQTEKVDMAGQRLVFRRVKRSAVPAQAAHKVDPVGSDNVLIDLSLLSSKTRKWLADQGKVTHDPAAAILSALERHASRMQRLKILEKYQVGALGGGSDSLDLLKEGRSDR
jgi:hypothetical protein